MYKGIEVSQIPWSVFGSTATIRSWALLPQLGGTFEKRELRTYAVKTIRLWTIVGSVGNQAMG